MALSKIKTGSLAADAVTSAAIADGAIVIADLADGSITSPKLATQTGNVTFADNAKVIFGAGSDLQIYHNSFNNRSFIAESGTADLYIQANDLRLVNTDSSAFYAYFVNGGAATLYHNNNAKIATTSTGIDVTGTVTANGLTVDGDVTFTGDSYNVTWTKSSNQLLVRDNARVAFGNSADLRLYHDGSNSFIDETGTGDLYIRAASNLYLGKYTGEILASFAADGAASLYYDNSPKLATTNTGIDVTGTVTADGLTVDTNTLHVDATNNRVGIGTTSPTQRLDVSGELNTVLRIDGTATSNIVWAEGGVNKQQIYMDDGNLVVVDLANSSERMRIDSSGRMLIAGTSTSSGAKLQVHSAASIVSASSTADHGINLIPSASLSTGQYTPFITFCPNTGATNRARAAIGAVSTNATASMDLVFCTRSAADGTEIQAGTDEKVRITSSGHVFIGKTTTDFNTAGIALRSEDVIQVARSGGTCLDVNRKTSDGAIINIAKDGTVVGTISVTSSGVTYNTTSDARLKTDIQPIPDATAKILAMNPVIHKWIADPEADAVHGFIAQEMQEVIPVAVSGDAESDEMMSMDYGRITPVIVAALQDALKEIEVLKQRINELEAK